MNIYYLEALRPTSAETCGCNKLQPCSLSIALNVADCVSSTRISLEMDSWSMGVLGRHQACGVNRYSGRRRLKTCRFGWLRPLSRSFKEARPAIFRQFAHQCTLQPRKSVVHLETNLSTLNICIYNPCWRDDLKPGPKPVRIYENCHVLHSAVQLPLEDLRSGAKNLRMSRNPLSWAQLGRNVLQCVRYLTAPGCNLLSACLHQHDNCTLLLLKSLC